MTKETFEYFINEKVNKKVDHYNEFIKGGGECDFNTFLLHEIAMLEFSIDKLNMEVGRLIANKKS